MNDVAIVHDYLTQRGGAERVVLALAEAFPAATVHTTVWDREACYPEFADLDVSTSILDRIPAVRRDPRLALPLLAPVVSTTTVDARVVVCSSSGWAHGIRTTGRRLVYAHTPARWLYRPEIYRDETGRAGRMAMGVLGPALAAWDRRAAGRADRYLANSTATADLVRRVYGREATVLNPPTTLDADGPQRPVEGVEPGFVLCVARPRGYKNVATVMRAASRPGFAGRRLVVVGVDEGDAPADVTGLGRVGDDEMRWLYAHAALLVAAAREDFGLTPLEAAAAGVPTVALRAGGYLDSIDEHVSGIHFDTVDPAAVAAAVGEALSRDWDRAAIRAHAASFSRERFVAAIRGHVEELAALS